MEKNLLLTKKDNNYVLMDGENELMELVGLKVDSQILFERVYLTENIEEREFKVNVSTFLQEKEDERILKQLQALFKNIENSIKLQFDDDH